MRLLEAIRRAGIQRAVLPGLLERDVRQVREPPQTETTPFHPRSPYACAKVSPTGSRVNYREAYGLHASNGILFNHESPRRGETFVTRKITRAVGAHQAGMQDELYPGQPGRRARLGLCAGVRGGDVADAAAGQAGRLRDRHRGDALGREFVEEAFDYAGLDRRSTCGSTPGTSVPPRSRCWWPTLQRPKRVLKFEPRIKFEELTRIMVDADMRAAGLEPIGEGDAILKKKFPQRWWAVD